MWIIGIEMCFGVQHECVLLYTWSQKTKLHWITDSRQKTTRFMNHTLVSISVFKKKKKNVTLVSLCCSISWNTIKYKTCHNNISDHLSHIILQNPQAKIQTWTNPEVVFSINNYIQLSGPNKTMNFCKICFLVFNNHFLILLRFCCLLQTHQRISLLYIRVPSSIKSCRHGITKERWHFAITMKQWSNLLFSCFANENG